MLILLQYCPLFPVLPAKLLWYNVMLIDKQRLICCRFWSIRHSWKIKKETKTKVLFLLTTLINHGEGCILHFAIWMWILGSFLPHFVSKQLIANFFVIPLLLTILDSNSFCSTPDCFLENKNKKTYKYDIHFDKHFLSKHKIVLVQHLLHSPDLLVPLFKFFFLKLKIHL